MVTPKKAAILTDEPLYRYMEHEKTTERSVQLAQIAARLKGKNTHLADRLAIKDKLLAERAKTTEKKSTEIK